MRSGYKRWVLQRKRCVDMSINMNVEMNVEGNVEMNVAVDIEMTVKHVTYSFKQKYSITFT